VRCSDNTKHLVDRATDKQQDEGDTSVITNN